MELLPAMTEISWSALLMLAAGSSVFGLGCSAITVWMCRRLEVQLAVVRAAAVGEFMIMTGALLFLLMVAFPTLWGVPA